MTRFLVFVLIGATTLLGAEVSPSSVPADQAPSVTFNRDVLPVLQENCQSCHRPGQIAPMSFMTYESVRPWAKAIKAAVISRKMPPWLADPDVGTFRNAPKLTDANIQTLVAWADGGAPEGDAADKPAPAQWVEGWRIQPDITVSMPQPYRVVAKGDGEIKEFIIPSPFREDTWVTSIEIRPGDPSVVHHVILQMADPPSPVANSVAVKPEAHCRGQSVEGDAIRTSSIADGKARGSVYYQNGLKTFERTTGCGIFATMEAIYAPGSQPLDFRFTESAKLIRGGESLRLEVHYTPNGKETTDQTSVGFTLARAPAQRRFVIMAPGHMVDTRKPLRAGDANLETRGELTFDRDVDLVWFMPHMHLRGKDMTFRLIYPDGRERTVLKARFNFNWQLGYEVEEPIHAPRGTRMIVTAHHDNSANNPSNPGPDKDVGWGELTSQEMMLPWFGVVVEGDVQPDMIASYRPGDFDGPLPTLRPQTSAGSANASSAKPKEAVQPTPAPENFPKADQSDIGFWTGGGLH